MTPVRSRPSGSSRSHLAATAPAMLSALTSATLPPSLSNAHWMSPFRLASTASFSAGTRWRMNSSITAAFMPAAWSGAKGLPASTASSCFASPTRTTRGIRSSPAIRRRSRAWTVGASEPLVHHEDRLPERRPHRVGALPREPPLRDARVAGEEPLEGLRGDPGFRGQGLRRRGRGREARHAPALPLRKPPRTVQHGGLAGPGVALHADDPVLRGQDQLYRVLLPGRERPPAEMRPDHPTSHRGAVARLAGAHERHGLALLADGAVRRERIPRARHVHGTACRDPDLSRPATSRSTSPIETRPGACASAAARRSLRANTASRSERCAMAQATASAASDGGDGSGSSPRPSGPSRASARCGSSPGEDLAPSLSAIPVSGVTPSEPISAPADRSIASATIPPASNPRSAACCVHTSRSSSRPTSRFAARVISAARSARRGFSPGMPRPRASIAASISARRVENPSFILGQARK